MANLHQKKFTKALKVNACINEQENDELRNQIIVLKRDLGVRTKQIGKNPLFSKYIFFKMPPAPILIF